MIRSRKVEDHREFEQAVDEYVTQMDYSVHSKTDTEAVVVDRDFGSIWWHILFLFTTAGLGNLVYAAYRYFTPDKVVIEIRD